MDYGIIYQIIVLIISAVILYYIVIYLFKKFPPQGDKLRFCPNCGSQDMNVKFKSFALHGAGTPTYICKNCEFKAIIFPVAKNEEELKKIQKKLSKD